VKLKWWFCVFWAVFKRDLCLATSFKRSRRELSIDGAEHSCILKNDQNTLYPRFSFIPKTGTVFHKMGVLLLLCIIEPTSCSRPIEHSTASLPYQTSNLVYFRLNLDICTYRAPLLCPGIWVCPFPVHAGALLPHLPVAPGDPR